jgi:hypothetical protein
MRPRPRRVLGRGREGGRKARSPRARLSCLWSPTPCPAWLHSCEDGLGVSIFSWENRLVMCTHCILWRPEMIYVSSLTQMRQSANAGCREPTADRETCLRPGSKQSAFLLPTTGHQPWSPHEVPHSQHCRGTVKGNGDVSFTVSCRIPGGIYGIT